MRLLALAALCLTFIAGCQPSAGTIPVKGKLSLKGAPAPEGTMISFVPIGGGETASGKVKGGEFELFSGVRGDVGAKPGKYKVVIAAGSAPDKDAYSGSKAGKNSEAPGASTGGIPKEYLAAETTPLEKEVASGANYDIDIP